MDWRMIVPLLCLIGILHVPGNAVQADNTTTATPTTTVMNQNALTTNETASPATTQAANQTASSATTQTTNQTASSATTQTTNQTASSATTQTTNQTASSATTQTTNQTASSATTQTTNQTASSATTQITNQTASPTTTHATNQTANTATTHATNQTANTATTQTEKNPTDAPTTTAPAKVAQINLAFSITQEFSENFTDLNKPETKELANKIKNEFTPVYKQKFPNFVGMDILGFSKGSIVVNSVLKFDTANGTSPNETDTKSTLVAAISNGNLSFTINQTSITAAKVPETTATTQNASLAVNQTANTATTQTASLAVNQTANTATTHATNQTANTATTQTAKPTDAPTTTAPAKVAQINLAFSIAQEFSDNFTDLSKPETKALATKITNEFTPVYKKKFPNFLRMTIRKFSKGSIVVDSVLEFDTANGTSPNETETKSTLVEAIKSGNLSFTINDTSITAANVPETTASPPATTPATNTTVAPTTTAKVAQVNLGFSIADNFSQVLSNQTHPDTIALINKITTELFPFYKRRFPNFLRMLIRKFSQGSIVVDSVLEFDTTNGTSPNETETKSTLVEAINSGNLTFSVNNTSITASAVPENGTTTANITTTTQATTVSAATPLTEYNITFKLNEVFTSDLSDMTSAGAIKLAKNITTELDRYFIKFPNFNRTVVLRFRNGSINTDGQIGFNGKTNNPTASDLATGLADAVRKGIVKLSIDPKSIQVTDPSGVSANRSPMLASMLTALWMTLASLLLSAVMH